MFSPLSQKRFRNFWRMRRARVSFLSLVGLFVFSLFSEWVCPYKPGDVIDPKTLESRRTVRVSLVPSMRIARMNLLPDLTVTRPVSCDAFFPSLTSATRLSDVFTVSDALRKSLARRFAGEACPRETFSLAGIAGMASAVASLPVVPPRANPHSVRLMLRQEGTPALPFTLLFRQNESHAPVPVSPRAWRLRVPESAHSAVLAMVTAAFAGEAPSQTIPWPDASGPLSSSATVSCARDEISWPYPPVKGHCMGIDSAGRDVFTRIVYGMRVALLFGLLLVVWAVVGGVAFGALQGYFGGWVDILGQRVTEIWSAMPFLYVMIFVGSALGRSFTLLLVCYGLFNWIGIAAYMRAEFLRLRHLTFVEAAQCQGLSTSRILFSHILPNALTPLITLFPFSLIGAVGSLAALDFLGFGLPPLAPSWGELLQQAQQFRWAWWLILFPSLALFTVMLLAVLIGEGLRDAFDPRQQSKME